MEKVKSCVLIPENKAALNNLVTNSYSSVDWLTAEESVRGHAWGTCYKWEELVAKQVC